MIRLLRRAAPYIGTTFLAASAGLVIVIICIPGEATAWDERLAELMAQGAAVCFLAGLAWLRVGPRR